jgi:hypothetical protein
VIAVKLPSQRFKSNEMPVARSRPCMPDTRLAGLVRSDAGRRILTGEGEGALAGMRVGAAPASIRMQKKKK